MLVARTLVAIGRALDRATRGQVVELLPAPLHEPLLRGFAGPAREPGSARDLAAIVCETLAAELDDRSLTRLRQLVPEHIARFLVRQVVLHTPATRPPHGAHVRPTQAQRQSTANLTLALGPACGHSHGCRWPHMN
jgi:hypothetical protein